MLWIGTHSDVSHIITYIEFEAFGEYQTKQSRSLTPLFTVTMTTVCKLQALQDCDDWSRDERGWETTLQEKFLTRGCNFCIHIFFSFVYFYFLLKETRGGEKREKRKREREREQGRFNETYTHNTYKLHLRMNHLLRICLRNWLKSWNIFCISTFSNIKNGRRSATAEHVARSHSVWQWTFVNKTCAR